jgi:hypothetical protein
MAVRPSSYSDARLWPLATLLFSIISLLHSRDVHIQPRRKIYPSRIDPISRVHNTIPLPHKRINIQQIFSLNAILVHRAVAAAHQLLQPSKVHMDVQVPFPWEDPLVPVPGEQRTLGDPRSNPHVLHGPNERVQQLDKGGLPLGCRGPGWLCEACVEVGGQRGEAEVAGVRGGKGSV